MYSSSSSLDDELFSFARYHYTACCRSCFSGRDSTTLTDAIELARSQEQHEYTLRSPVEADAVMQAVRKDSYLHLMGVSRDGLTVRCQHDGMGFLARLILRERFLHAWDFAIDVLDGKQSSGSGPVRWAPSGNETG